MYESSTAAIVLGRPGRDDLPAGLAALGPEVDDPVGLLDHVEVVLDHEHRVPGVDEALEHLEQLLDVGEVEAGGRLVEDVQRASGRDLAELGGQLHALRLPARQRRRRLAEGHVVETDVVQRLQAPPDLRDLREEAERLLDRHLEDVGDRLPLEAHLERLAVVAPPLAGLARHVHVRQEMHLDLDLAVALAGLAAAALDVEAEPAGLVAAHLRVGRERVELPDVGEEVGVGRRIRPRRPADRALVDLDHLVEHLDPLDALVLARLDPNPLEPVRERLVDDLVHERRLAGARDARDRDEAPDGELDVDVLEVVLCGAAHGEVAAILGPPLRHRDRAGTRQELPGHGLAVSLDLGRRPLGDDVPAVLAGAGAHVDEPVGAPHHLLVVLDHDDGVAEVAEPLERADEPVVVALVKPDRRLVEDVEDADELRADLGREPQALRLPARQRGRRAVEREIADADVVEEREPLADLLHDRGPRSAPRSRSARARRGSGAPPRPRDG